MPDIAMCFGKNCKRAQTCWRHIAPMSPHQSVGAYDQDPEDCTSYIEAKCKSQVKRLKTMTKVETPDGE